MAVVVVTGIGAVSAYGWGASQLWQGLLSGSSVGPAQQFDVAGHRTGVVSEILDDAGSQTIDEGLDSRAEHFAVAAAREAVAMAAIDLDDRASGLYFGGSTAGMAEGERFFAALLGDESPPRLRDVQAQPLNAPGDAVARDLGINGPVMTVSSACASGTLALREAAAAIRAGEVDVAVAGGADSLCQLTYSGFNSLRAIDEQPCRPFRKQRAGLSLGEGAGVMVLESLEQAQARGARVLAVLVGAGASCDAHHMTAPRPDGEGAALAIRDALADAGMSPDEVDFVNAHGTGTPLNDASEARAFEAVFGDRSDSLPVTSSKGAIGHLLGSAGAIEAVATIQCLVAKAVHPTAGVGDADQEAQVDLVLGSARQIVENATGLSVNLAFGGANAAVLFSSPEPDPAGTVS